LPIGKNALHSNSHRQQIRCEISRYWEITRMDDGIQSKETIKIITDAIYERTQAMRERCELGLSTRKRCIFKECSWNIQCPVFSLFSRMGLHHQYLLPQGQDKNYTPYHYPNLIQGNYFRTNKSHNDGLDSISPTTQTESVLR